MLVAMNNFIPIYDVILINLCSQPGMLGIWHMFYNIVQMRSQPAHYEQFPLSMKQE